MDAPVLLGSVDCRNEDRHIIAKQLFQGALFVLLWCFTYAVGMPVALAVTDELPLAWETSAPLAGATIGACLGLPQWVLLRRRLDRAWLWIVATVSGWMIGHVLWLNGIEQLLPIATGRQLYELFREWGQDWWYVIEWSAISVPVAMAQWLVLWRQTSWSYSGIWVPTVLLGQIFMGWQIESAGMFNLLISPVAAAVPGFLTGIVLHLVVKGAPRRE